MSTVSLSKSEYQELKRKASIYELLENLIKQDSFASPPLQDSKKILKEFKKTGFYNDKFLSSLEKGLKRSTYFK